MKTWNSDARHETTDYGILNWPIDTEILRRKGNNSTQYSNLRFGHCPSRDLQCNGFRLPFNKFLAITEPTQYCAYLTHATTFQLRATGWMKLLLRSVWSCFKDLIISPRS